MMSERHRALPSWMSKREVKMKEKEKPRSRMKRKAARAVFYCMNEKELAEAAASYLARCCEGVAPPSGQKVEAKSGDPAVKTRRTTASSMTIAKPQTEALVEESSEDMAYVSETDLDITEVETVPYTSSQRQGTEDQRSEAVQDHSRLMNVRQKTEKDEVHVPEASDEDDALQLVRDIFFT